MFSRWIDNGKTPLTRNMVVIPQRASLIRRELNRIVLLWLVCGVLLFFAAGAARQFALRDIIVLLTYDYLIYIVSFLLVKRGNESYGLLFIVAVIIRLTLVVFLEAFPPESLNAVRYVPGVVFDDETYYLESARMFSQSWETFQQHARLANRYEHVALYYALAHLIAGEEVLWGRLLNTLVGGMVSIVLYDLILRAVGAKVQRWAWWFAVLSPVLVIWSTFYLKELLLVLGVALVTNAIIRIHFGRFALIPILMLAVGTIIAFWVRAAVLLPLVIPLALSVFVLKNNVSRKSIMFLPFSISLIALLVFTTFSPVKVSEWGSFVVAMGDPGVIYKSASIQSQGIENTFPFFNRVMQLSGVLRNVGLIFFLILSPVVTLLWSFIPVFGLPSWAAFSMAAYAASWWICLPFCIRFLYDTVRQKDTWWLSWAGGFMVWFVIAAFAGIGFGWEAVRYRDIMVPVIMLMASKGLKSTLLKWRRGGSWPLMLKSYWIIIGALLLFHRLGILRFL